MNNEQLEKIKAEWEFELSRARLPMTIDAAETIITLVSEVQRLRELVTDAANMLPTHQAKAILNSMREGEET